MPLLTYSIIQSYLFVLQIFFPFWCSYRCGAGYPVPTMVDNMTSAISMENKDNHFQVKSRQSCLLTSTPYCLKRWLLRCCHEWVCLHKAMPLSLGKLCCLYFCAYAVGNYKINWSRFWQVVSGTSQVVTFFFLFGACSGKQCSQLMSIITSVWISKLSISMNKSISAEIGYEQKKTKTKKVSCFGWDTIFFISNIAFTTPSPLRTWPVFYQSIWLKNRNPCVFIAQDWCCYAWVLNWDLYSQMFCLPQTILERNRCG